MSNNSKNKNLTAIIILGLIIIVAAITNPDESVHKSEVKDLMYSQMNLEKDLLIVQVAVMNGKLQVLL